MTPDPGNRAKESAGSLKSFRLSSPLGPLVLLTAARYLTGIRFQTAGSSAVHDLNGIARRVGEQLQRYFSDPAWVFDLPLDLQGTDFQRTVWEQLQRIPAGTSTTYGQLAQALNTSPRAVGNACRANPCPIVVPCHRVVAAGGVGGYAGRTGGRPLAVKRWLLEHEGIELERRGG